MTLDDLDPGDVVVRVAYSDVNYKDALAATGKGRILRRPSCVGGIDLSGTVVSSTDARFKKGDAVLGVGYDLGVSHHGGYAQYARMPGDWLIKLPQGMSLWDAMAFGTAGYTAGIAIVRMEHDGLKPANGPVIVNGATGGVGSIALAALAKLGYHVVALTGKEERGGLAEEARREGGRAAQRASTWRRSSRSTRRPGPARSTTSAATCWRGSASTMKDNGVIGSIGLAASPT